MKFMSRFKTLSVALALGTSAALVPATSAHADSLNIAGWWGGNRWDASMTLGAGMVNYHDDSVLNAAQNSGPFGAGGFNTVNSTTGATFLSWCVDVFHSFYFNSPTSQGVAELTNASFIFGATRAADLGRLATEAYAVAGNTNSSGDNAAAFQLAVWEIVNENSGGAYNLGSGNFKASAGGNATSIAQGWLDNLPSTSIYSADIWMMQNTGNGGWGPQDVLVFTAAVPEPETYALMLAGFGLMGVVVRRRRQHRG